MIALAGVFFVEHRNEIGRFGELLHHARPAWLIVALACQFLTYFCVAAGWQTVLRRSGSIRSLWQLAPISVVKLFADQMLPSAGISGNLVLIERLTAIDVPRGDAMATLIVSTIGFYLAYAVMALATLGTLWLHRDATPLFVGLTTTFMLVALAIPALALRLRARGSRPLPPRLERISAVASLLRIIGETPAMVLSDRRLLARVALFNAAVFLCDAMTLTACLAALGGPVIPTSAFVALIAASMVVTLGPIPFGLGTFEATCVMVLHLLGVSVAGALAATMLFRLLATWLPLAAGMVMVGRRRLIRAARSARASSKPPPAT
ncbi:MAG: lysylphosphatidylglycerol synthase transmembrane domain-containing protein [Candidatus Sphingomonas colombiensis]|nr:lysylphosphatidylglycerol synthase transmembrane domain-containing protein [Sphingomonas sp.]WEK43211.1 MAG: lysylphosphatidylglycerol synthase transmembrane domain-containing protein [Sphingomonas sp.]